MRIDKKLIVYIIFNLDFESNCTAPGVASTLSITFVILNNYRETTSRFMHVKKKRIYKFHHSKQ